MASDFDKYDNEAQIKAKKCENCGGKNWRKIGRDPQGLAPQLFECRDCGKLREVRQ